MKISITDNYKIIVIFISIFSFLISVWQSTYIYDSHHWGLMASNAFDFLNNKMPYEEIFIQYGILTTIIHSIFMKIGNQSVLSIFFFTSLIYSISIYYFFLILKNKFQDQMALFAVVCLVLIHPFVNHPWHNYLTFFFLIMSLFFLEKDNRKDNLIAGLFFSFAVLAYEKFLIVFIFFLIGYAFINLRNKKIKNILFLLIGFSLPIFIFFTYIIFNEIFDDWMKYHSISNFYIGENPIIVILKFLKNIFLIGVKRFIFEPYWIFFLFLLIINITFICMFVIKKNFLKKEEEYLVYISLISISSFSSAIHALNSFRLATGAIIGIFILIHFLKKIKNIESTKIISLSLIVLLCLGVNLKKSENNKLFITPISFESYSNDKIQFFKNLKFNKDTWSHMLYFDQKINEINQKCKNVNFAINYTNNNYYYLLISDVFETFQVKPGINTQNTLDMLTLELINPNLESNLQNKINKNSTIIVADLSYKVPKNYSYINLPYSYENKYKIILIPKKCKNII